MCSSTDDVGRCRRQHSTTNLPGIDRLSSESTISKHRVSKDIQKQDFIQRALNGLLRPTTTGRRYIFVCLFFLYRWCHACDEIKLHNYNPIQDFLLVTGSGRGSDCLISEKNGINAYALLDWIWRRTDRLAGCRLILVHSLDMCVGAWFEICASKTGLGWGIQWSVQSVAWHIPLRERPAYRSCSWPEYCWLDWRWRPFKTLIGANPIIGVHRSFTRRRSLDQPTLTSYGYISPMDAPRDHLITWLWRIFIIAHAVAAAAAVRFGLRHLRCTDRLAYGLRSTAWTS